MIGKNLKVAPTYKGVFVSLELVNKSDGMILSQLQECELLDVKIGKHRKNRSLTANGTLWMLLQRLAEVLGTTKDELYLQFLEQYGTFTHIVVKPNAVDKVKNEWRTVRELGEVTINGKTGIQLQCYFGSSTMNSKEFSRLLQGVIDECEAQGLETITSSEFQHIIDNYKED